MVSIDEHKESIHKLLTSISKVIKLDVAVINDKGKLVVCTSRYVRHKGEAVHIPSIKQTMAQGSFLFDKPGHMDSCLGCRFYAQCPAKVELLNSIKINNRTLGVISLTSFSVEGRNRLSKHTDNYLQILHELSELIVTIVKNGENANSVRKTTVPSRKGRLSLNQLKGNSSPIRDIKLKIERLKQSTSTVLLTGETGTGKSAFAKAIHYSSNRMNAPFIAINCASIPESLFESELFGYEAGAFTGAKKSGKPGLFELANGGTLFLDEVGDLPLHVQPKLLNVLQELYVQRVGGIHPIPINVRIIAATNQNLRELIDKKRFRADLYYRLSVIPLNIPPLRKRQDDIDVLANEFLRSLQKKTGRMVASFSEEAMDLLKNYHWPGNVRELENVVEYALNMETTDTIAPSSLPETVLTSNKSIRKNMKLEATLLEKEMIRNALDDYGYDYKGKTLVAKQLGISVRTLYRRMKQYKINKDAVKPTLNRHSR